MSPQEKLFIQIALSKRFINEEIVRQAKIKQMEYKQENQNVSLPQILLKYKVLSTEQMDQIQLEYKFRTSTIPSLPEMQVPKTSNVKITNNFKPGDKIFNHYTIGKELGRGGMGVVYKAYDLKLKRTVALKLLLAKSATRIQKERFKLEAESMAQLEHPNIVKVYEIGETPEIFFTMEYIAGSTLEDCILQKTMSLKKQVEVIKKIADVLHYIHKNGFIHRDVKPANIMVIKDKEPKIMDFGLVKAEGHNLSKTSDILGTPAFMPPEQLTGEKIDEKMDIYSLGGVLYQTLTMLPPFRGESNFNIMFQITNKDPVSPREINPDIHPNLEAICLKCLQKKQGKRYKTAKALANDLDNFLNNKPILAKPPSYLERTLKWGQHNKLIVVGIGIAFISLIILFLFVQINNEMEKEKIVLENQKITLKNQKIIQEQDLEAKRDEVIESVYYDSKISFMKEHLKKANLQLVKRTQKNITHNINTANLQVLKSWEWGWIEAALQNQLKTIQGNKVYCSSFGKNKHKKLVIICGSQNIKLFKIGGKKTTIKELHVEDTNLIDAQTIVSCAFSPDGIFFVTGSKYKNKNAKLILWKIVNDSLQVLDKIEDNNEEITSCQFSSDGMQVVFGSSNGDVKTWNIRTRKTTTLTNNSSSNKDDVVICKFLDNKNVIVVYKKSIVEMYNLETGKKISHNIGIGNITACDIYKNSLLISYKERKSNLIRIGLFRKKPGRQIISFEKEIIISKENKSARAIFFNNDQEFAVAKKNIIEFYKINKKDKIIKYDYLIRHQEIKNFSLNYDKTLVVIIGKENVQICNLAHKNPIRIKNKQGVYPFAKLIGNKIVSKYRNMSLKYWEIPNEFHFSLENLKKGSIRSSTEKIDLTLFSLLDCAMSNNNIVLAKKNNFTQVYLGEKNEVYNWKKPEKGAVSCSLSPKNIDLLASVGNRKFFLRNIRNKKIIYESKISDMLKGILPNTIYREAKKVTFRSDGKQLAIVGKFPFVILFDVKKLKVSYLLSLKNKYSHSYLDCQYSRDGKKLVIASKEKILMSFEVNENGKFTLASKQVYSLGHQSEVYSCAFSHDGKRIISGGKDGQLIVWNATDKNTIKGQDKSPLIILKKNIASSNTNSIHYCTFSKNGQYIISADNEEILIWKASNWEKK